MDIADQGVLTLNVTRAKSTGPSSPRLQGATPQTDQPDLDARPSHGGGTIIVGIPVAVFNRSRDSEPWSEASENRPEPPG